MGASGTRTLILTGRPGSGKTRAALSLLEAGMTRGLRVLGVVQPGLVRDSAGLAEGFDSLMLNNLGGKEVRSLRALARRDSEASFPGDLRLGAYRFDSSVFQAALDHFAQAFSQARGGLPPDLLVLDELGRLEAQGLGLGPCLDLVLGQDPQPHRLVLACRLDLVEHWQGRLKAHGRSPELCRLGADGEHGEGEEAMADFLKGLPG